MATKKRNPALNLEAYLASEAVLFLKTHYKNVPDAVSGCVFQISAAALILLGEQKAEGLERMFMMGELSKIHEASQRIASDLFNHLLKTIGRLSLLAKALRQHQSIRVRRDGEWQNITANVATDKEILSDLQARHNLSSKISEEHVARCRRRLAKSEIKRIQRCQKATEDARAYLKRHSIFKQARIDTAEQGSQYNKILENNESRSEKWQEYAIKIFPNSKDSIIPKTKR